METVMKYSYYITIIIIIIHTYPENKNLIGKLIKFLFKLYFKQKYVPN